MFQTIQESASKIQIPKETKISRKLPVFYNPVMKFNRDITILLLNSIPNKNLQIALPLAGTGIRGIRFLKELKKDKIKEIHFNDLSENAVKLIKKNLNLNRLKSKKIYIHNQDANLFLLNSNGFDYIDIDPFGSPNDFLNNSIVRLSRNSILAVTATDTAALTGTYINACKRKYWAVPKKDYQMHEMGIRILIRKIQLIGSQFDKALTPIFSFYKDHYYRIFFRCEKGKSKVDQILKQYGMFNEAGPMWVGELWDTDLTKVMLKNNNVEENKKFLEIIDKESKIHTVGFFDIHKLCKKYKLKIPKKELILKRTNASPTHFSDIGIRASLNESGIVQVLKKL